MRRVGPYWGMMYEAGVEVYGWLQSWLVHCGQVCGIDEVQQEVCEVACDQQRAKSGEVRFCVHECDHGQGLEGVDHGGAEGGRGRGGWNAGRVLTRTWQ